MPKAAVQKSCRNCSDTFTVTPRDLSFYESIEVPPPSWCPDCRMLRRMAHCNEGILYPGSCALCSKRVIPPVIRAGSGLACVLRRLLGGAKDGEERTTADLLFSIDLFRAVSRARAHRAARLCFNRYGEREQRVYAPRGRGPELLFHLSCLAGTGLLLRIRGEKAVDCVDVHNCFVSELCYEVIDVD